MPGRAPLVGTQRPHGGRHCVSRVVGTVLGLTVLLAPACCGSQSSGWGAAVQRIAYNPVYAGLSIDPQAGLVPLGPDSHSGLEEFAHPESGDVPSREQASGALVLSDETSIVFVLLPGGTRYLGAQSAAESSPNFDPMALDTDGPVKRVEVEAFFLSKYELTAGQWRRLGGDLPRRAAGRASFRPLEPIESVSWMDCQRVLGSAGLSMPSEFQWEYACRAGTSTPWWPGARIEDLRDVAWIGDLTHTAPHPVGRLRANAFGLHDVHGNVCEWCADGWADHLGEPPGTQVTVPFDRPLRAVRGGSSSNEAYVARSAARGALPIDVRISTTGVRPARAIVGRRAAPTQEGRGESH